jgi:glycosyltransferase involved in cell wall biosynthesis
MKIAYLARKPIPSVNAHSVQIVKMCEGFTRIGHEVTLFGQPGDAPDSTIFDRYGVTERFRIRTFPRRRLLPKWHFALRLLRDRQVREADAFYARDVIGLMAVARMGKPLILEAHLLPPEGTLRRRLLRRLFERPNFSHLVTVTSTLADMYRTLFPALSDKHIIVAPNAGSEFPSARGASTTARRNGRLQVGFVGRPYPGKGIETIAAAAHRLPECDFHVIGAEAADLNWVEQPFAPNLHLHGYQPHGRLGGYLRSFDIAVAPYGSAVSNASGVESAAITSPLKLLEYMAAGLPSVVSDLPGVRDVLDCDECALLVPPGDLDAFVAAVARLAADADLRSAMGASARRRYRDQRTAEARARVVLEPITPAGQAAAA